MEIRVVDLQREIRTDLEKIKAKARKILDVLACREAELSIALVDDERMSSLNWEYRRRKGATNVLSFAMREGEFGDVSPQLLGDVVISLPTAARQAVEAGISLDAMLSRLLVHGILHLLGFDHEGDEDSERQMAEKTRELLERLAAME
ncbi:MAG: rRNA maturation RNase YbeY [Deltaproteobacteria bacterium]|nr:rRNA maturation RNase YbeY [Deltaproteobacteria bacterium]MBW2070846.1 rRNA maturation RNase YbeY [Deltaproteobacteria bacterium]